MRATIIRFHRWISLALAAFWLVQAVTGALIVFHWEMSDAAYAGPHRATELAGIGRAIARIEAGGSARVTALWTTAGLADRYTLFVSDGRAVQLAGDGTQLVARSSLPGPVIDTLVVLHQSLLSGETGEWIVGVSGIVLLANLLFGLVVALPRTVRLKQALRPSRRGGTAARRYSLHRAIGLWAVLPALLVVASGTLLRFENGTGRLVGYSEPESPAIVAPPAATGRPPVGFARAAATALAAVPGATLVSAAMPGTDDATYRFRVRQPGELARAYGKSEVFVSASDGRLIAAYPESAAPPARRFMDALFALHTGEAGGIVGRVLVLLIGLWLATMVVLGIRLWHVRRKRKPQPKRSGPIAA